MTQNLTDICKQLIRKTIQTQIEAIKPQYAKLPFFDYLYRYFEQDENKMAETLNLRDQLEHKWQSFLGDFLSAESENLKSILQNCYPDYSKDPEYIRFLIQIIKSHDDPLEKALEIENSIGNQRENPNRRLPPYLWEQYLAQSFNRDLLTRLRTIKDDKLFDNYYKERISSKQSVQDQGKKATNYLKFLEALVYHWITNQLYFQFLNHLTAHILNFLEIDFKSYRSSRIHKRQVKQKHQQKNTNNTPASHSIIMRQKDSFESQLNLLKEDRRFLVEIKEGESSEHRHLDVSVSKNAREISCPYEKLKLRIFTDNPIKIEIQETPYAKGFMGIFKADLDKAVANGDLRGIIELWATFLNEHMNRERF